MDLTKYIYGHCVNPHKVKIWDTYSNSYVVRELPCGKCLHCKNTHINEWVTRLFAQKSYSKYVYYVSLDYAPFTVSNAISLQLARETAACYHNINKNANYGMHPLVLCKNHLQDFFKRLRKNTGIKLQYFSCGEYGMHANGRGYGRPHFHNIIFTNEPITISQFEQAWCIDGYKIGRVDFQDLNNLALGSVDLNKIFKYVCKYLQKSDFSFEKLSTIKFHRAYFKSLNMVMSKADLFSPTVYNVPGDGKEKKLSWSDYTKLYAPFVVCSRRPSIGSAYFSDNLERFKEQDFRLFGLPKECSTFPRYFVRRTKESLYPIFALGSVSQKPSSNSRMGYIFQILDFLYRDKLDFSNFSEESTNSWCVYKSKKGGEQRLKIKDLEGSIALSELSFYDNTNKFLYQFDGFRYNVWAKLKGQYALFDNMDIYDVLKEFSPSWDNYYHNFIRPLHLKRVLFERELDDTISALYVDRDKFYEEVNARYQIELDTIYKTNLLRQNSHQTL